jgi:hypothetical protein
MRHIYSILCTRAVVDQVSNNLTIVEVVERLSGPAVTEPTARGIIAIPLDFVTLWARTNFHQGERSRARLRILGPNDADLGDAIAYAVDLEQFTRVRNMTRFAGLPFSGQGVYNLVVEMEAGTAWQEVARYPLEISLDLPIIPVEAVPATETSKGAIPGSPTTAASPVTPASPGSQTS